MRRPISGALALPLVMAMTACAAPLQQAAAPTAATAERKPPPLLTRSYFAKDPPGGLTENDLQRVLASPIDLQFPARVGVVPLARPFDAESHASLATRTTASRDFATALAGGPYFAQVSDISTDVPSGGGIEGLRAIAARYRMRYLVLYSERFEDRTHVNGLGAFYPTLIGMFVTPSVTVESQGLAQADLLDVRTGTVLFSVVEPMHVRSMEFLVGAARVHQELQTKAAAEAAKALARRVAAQTNQLVAYADEMSAPGAITRHPARILPAPVIAGDPRDAVQPTASP